MCGTVVGRITNEFAIALEVRVNMYVHLVSDGEPDVLTIAPAGDGNEVIRVRRAPITVDDAVARNRNLQSAAERRGRPGNS